MKKILFINPPVMCVNECQQGWYSFAHPTSILKLINWHRQQGHEISFIDCMEYDIRNAKTLEFYKTLPLGASNLDLEIDTFILGKSLSWLTEQLRKEEEPDEVWISCHITFNSGIAHQAIEIIREIYNKTRIIFGGSYPTLFPEDAAKSGAEVFSGLYEPAQAIFPDYSYFSHLSDYIVFQLDLGCENRCSHCVNHKLVKNIVRFNIEELVEDLRKKQQTYKIDNFINIDPNVAIYDLEPFLEACIRRDLQVNLFFYGGIQPDKVTKKLVKLMKKATVRGITLPRELDNRANINLQKNYKVEDFQKAVNLFRDQNVDISDFHCSFPVGFKDDCLIEISSIIYEMNNLGTIAEIAPVAFIPETPEYTRHAELLAGKSLEELNWALWPALDSAEKILILSRLYNLAHGNKFKLPWKIKSRS